MPSRSFSTPTNNEPVFFEIDGERFDCIPMLPAGYYLDVVTVGTAQQINFFDLVMEPVSAERFAERIREMDRPVPQALVNEIVRYLVEVYTGRPTTASNGSSGGPQDAETTSTAPASSPASTSTRSRRTAS